MTLQKTALKPLEGLCFPPVMPNFSNSLLSIDSIDETRFLTDSDYVQEISDLAQAMPKGAEKTKVYVYLEALLMARVYGGVFTNIATAQAA